MQLFTNGNALLINVATGTTHLSDKIKSGTSTEKDSAWSKTDFEDFPLLTFIYGIQKFSMVFRFTHISIAGMGSSGRDSFHYHFRQNS
jgi:hypothetical protein